MQIVEFTYELNERKRYQVRVAESVEKIKEIFGDCKGFKILSVEEVESNA